MLFVFELCPSEINSNDRLKQEYLESSSSTNENTISPLPEYPPNRIVMDLP